MRSSGKSKNGEGKPSNPFEEKWNKQTQRAKKKKKTAPGLVLHPSKSSGRNSFQDQRVGENNPKMSEEDRYLARLQRERTRGTKKRKRYNLTDAWDEMKAEERAAKEADEFAPKEPDASAHTVLQNVYDEDGDIALSDEDEEVSDVAVDDARVGDDGDSGDESDRSDHRTHREVMHEVMEKSKMYKAQRQQVKAVDEEYREVLDRELPEIMSLLTKSNNIEGNRKKDKVMDSKFDYEETLQMLAKESRARATTRLKTAEEKEAEERERLEELERTRLSRMQGLLDDSDEDSGNESAEDSETVAEVEKVLPSKKITAGASDKAVSVKTAEDVPYLFKKCPSESEELSNLLCTIAIELRGVVIERLLKCFAISLDPSTNGPKLRRLLVLLLDRVKALANSNRDNISNASEEIEVLVEHIYILSSKYPAPVIEWAREFLYEAYTALQQDSNVALSNRWGVSQLLMFRVLGKLFPGSDVRHTVITPMLLLLSEAMMPNRTKTDLDVAMCCFLCATFLEVSAASARISGQVIDFLARAVIRHSSRSGKEKSKSGKPSCANCGKLVCDVNPLALTDCFALNECTHVALKIANCTRNLVSAALFRGRLASADLVFSSLLEGLSGSPKNEDLANSLKTHFQTQATTRKALTLYLQKSVAVPKAVNPKFTAVNGVYRKHSGNRHKPATVQQMRESAKRVRKALKKEERGYARDLRKEAMRVAQHRNEQDIEKRAHTDAKTLELKLFLENQQATWNQASKKQKQMSGKKW